MGKLLKFKPSSGRRDRIEEYRSALASFFIDGIKVFGLTEKGADNFAVSVITDLIVWYGVSLGRASMHRIIDELMERLIGEIDYLDLIREEMEVQNAAESD